MKSEVLDLTNTINNNTAIHFITLRSIGFCMKVNEILKQKHLFAYGNEKTGTRQLKRIFLEVTYIFPSFHKNVNATFDLVKQCHRMR